MKKPELDTLDISPELAQISLNNCRSNSTGLIIQDRSVSVRGKNLKACLRCLEQLRKNKYLKK